MLDSYQSNGTVMLNSFMQCLHDTSFACSISTCTIHEMHNTYSIQLRHIICSYASNWFTCKGQLYIHSYIINENVCFKYMVHIGASNLNQLMPSRFESSLGKLWRNWMVKLLQDKERNKLTTAKYIDREIGRHDSYKHAFTHQWSQHISTLTTITNHKISLTEQDRNPSPF